MKQAIFLLALVFCLTPMASAPIALALGLVLALLGLTAWDKQSRKASRLIIQISIVLLGFSISLEEVAKAGASGLLFAAGTIMGTFALGWVMGLALDTEAKVTTLLCSGTAICGGSAIAATGSIIRATDAQMSVALAAVFTLNAIALYVFPPLGHALDLSQTQFGTWAAVAIHDMSSVVGAAKVYGDEALKVATVIKLSRVLWIMPVSILAALLVARSGPSGQSGAQPAARGGIGRFVPWFIALFLVASVVRTWVPWVSSRLFDLSWADQAISSPADFLKTIAKQGMVVALFLIGTGLSKKALTSVGWRPFALAIILWIAISTASLWVVRIAIA